VFSESVQESGLQANAGQQDEQPPGKTRADAGACWCRDIAIIVQQVATYVQP